MLRVDSIRDISDDADVDNSIISERDIRVDHDDFNPICDSRIVFAARLNPQVSGTLRA